MLSLDCLVPAQQHASDAAAGASWDDVPLGTCKVPWSVAHEANLLRFAPWTVLQCQPANLQQPDRFEHWSIPDMVGVRPGPGELFSLSLCWMSVGLWGAPVE